MMRNQPTHPKGMARHAERDGIARAAMAAGITIAIFPALTGADLYLSADRSGILPVNATAMSFISFSAVFSLILLTGLVRDRGRSFWCCYLVAAPLLVAFGLFTMARLAGGFLPAANWDGSGKFIYQPLYVFVLLLLSVGIASASVFRRYHRHILSACLLAAAGSIFVDVFYPGTFSKIYTRPAGFLINPNGGAATVAILAIATVNWTRSRASDMLLWLIAGTAAIATLSRGGILFFAVVFFLYNVIVARSGLRIYVRSFSILLAATTIVVTAYSAADLGSRVYSAENRRLQLIAGNLSGDSDLMADSRIALAYHYIDMISERPILGHGAGFVQLQTKGPHNTFLTLWVEHGLPGLVGYLTLIVVAFWYFRTRGDTRGQALCAGMFIPGIFDSDLLDLRPLIVALGLLSVLAIPQRVAGLGHVWHARRPSAGFLARRTDQGRILRRARGEAVVR
jgi:O-antigen ligase